MSFVFKLVTPDGIAYEDEIEKVAVPTLSGEIMIHEGHAPLVSVLSSGPLEITKKEGSSNHLAVSGGVLEVRHTGQVYVLSDMAIRAEHIDDEQIKNAQKRAEELLKRQKDVEDVDFARLQAMIDREMAKVNVGNKYRK